jgi:hypothetical protein
MADLRIDLAAEFKGKKAFKEADSAVSALDKSVSKLGKKLASVFAAQKIYAFGKASVKAFAEDQASAARLAKTVDNLGLSFANPAIDQFIKKLEMQSGIVDENLRPAFQAFLTTTGDVSKSMSLLTNAIDISRGSGIDLATVTQDLANGYVGITKGLKKYNLGLSQTQLKTMGFAQVMVALNKQFSGASATYLDTYAGKMDILNVAADNAKETIGSGLVDAFKTLTGNTGISNLSDMIGKLSTNIADFFRGLAIGFRDLANMPVIKQLLQLAGLGLQLISKVAGVVINPFVEAGKASRSKGYGDYAGSTADFKRLQDEKAATKAKLIADAKAAALAKASVKAQQQLTAEQKKQAALKKDSGIFDMQQIELIAALKGQLSDDDRKRAELQLALLNGNLDEADKLTKQILMAQDATGNLYRYFLQIPDVKNPFAYLNTYLDELQKKMNSLQFPDLSKPSTYTGSGIDPSLLALGVVAGYGANIPQTGDISNQASTTLGNGSYGLQSTSGFVDTSSVTGTNVKVYVSGSVVTEQELIDAIQAGLQSNSLSGAPSQIGRIAGMFG